MCRTFHALFAFSPDMILLAAVYFRLILLANVWASSSFDTISMLVWPCKHLWQDGFITENKTGEFVGTNHQPNVRSIARVAACLMMLQRSHNF
jgi:hypothetical protein